MTLPFVRALQTPSPIYDYGMKPALQRSFWPAQRRFTNQLFSPEPVCQALIINFILFWLAQTRILPGNEPFGHSEQNGQTVGGCMVSKPL